MTKKLRRFTKKYSLPLWSQLWSQTLISDTGTWKGTFSETISELRGSKLWFAYTIRPYGLWSLTLISCNTSLLGMYCKRSELEIRVGIRVRKTRKWCTQYGHTDSDTNSDLLLYMSWKIEVEFVSVCHTCNRSKLNCGVIWSVCQ